MTERDRFEYAWREENDMLTGERLQYLADLLPENVSWGDPLNAVMLGQILAAHSAGAQEPVAWAVYNGWSKIAFYISEEGARDHAKAAQRSHDLSGSLAAFRVVPLYAQPQPQTDAAREVALRLHVRQLLDFINNEGPAAKEWQAISETTERIGVLIAEIERLDREKGE